MHDSPSFPRAIVFDLDGTLIDSLPDIASALNEAMARHGLPPFDLPAVKDMIGGGVAQLMERAFATQGAKGGDIAAAVEDFLAIYSEHCAEGTTLYAGALELLQRLRDRGVKLAICTNKPQKIADNILNGLGIAHFFGAVIGERAGQPLKPAAEPLRLALAQLGEDASSAVMAGDSAADVGTARACGVPVVLVSFGYSRTPVHELGADAVIGRLLELEAVLSALYPV
jgi:phosphoglycolate phosphatase